MLPSQKSSADFTDAAEILGSRRGQRREKLKTKMHYQESPVSAGFGNTDTKTGTIQRLAWPLCKDDIQTHKAFHILLYFSNVHRSDKQNDLPTEATSCFKPHPQLFLQGENKERFSSHSIQQPTQCLIIYFTLPKTFNTHFLSYIIYSSFRRNVIVHI